MKKPFVSKELIENLEARFPDITPPLTATLDEIRFQSGQVSVVRFLRACYEEQNRKGGTVFNVSET